MPNLAELLCQSLPIRTWKQGPGAGGEHVYRSLGPAFDCCITLFTANKQQKFPQAYHNYRTTPLGSTHKGLNAFPLLRSTMQTGLMQKHPAILLLCSALCWLFPSYLCPLARPMSRCLPDSLTSKLNRPGA